MDLQNVLTKEELTRDEIIFLLSLTAEGDIKKLFQRSDEVRSKYCGSEIHLKGIIDFSNNCVQNCLYCGLREDNLILPRFRMTPDEIIDAAKHISNQGINSIVLQSGEDPYYDTDLIAYIIYSIKQKCDASITLSLGERGFDEYRTWRIAGADRYLLKHETANPKLYSVYHIRKKLDNRIAHLKFLRRIGFQIGSGNLVGLPMQTVEDIADDIILCGNLDLDLASFSPFIPSPNTPYRNKKPADFILALKTIAVGRIVLKKTFIPATTALTALFENGKLEGLKVGGNVIMPDFTPARYREKYLVYANRNSLIDSFENCRSCLENQLEIIGRKFSTPKSGNYAPN